MLVNRTKTKGIEISIVNEQSDAPSIPLKSLVEAVTITIWQACILQVHASCNGTENSTLSV